MMTEAFHTEGCDHKNMTLSLGKLEACLKAEHGTSNDDICGPFESTRECVISNMKNCFAEDDLQRIAKETQGAQRQAATKLLLNPSMQKAQGFVLTEAQVDSLYSACPNIPDKTFSDNVEPKQFFALEAGVQTDNNCTQVDISEINVGGGECVESQMEHAKSQLSRRLGSTRGSRKRIQSTICSVLDGTVGKCLRKPLPACFSERERVFLKTTMSKNLQNLFKALEDLLASKLGQISFSDCSVFSVTRSAYPISGSKIINPTSGMVYVFLAISFFYIIN